MASEPGRLRGTGPLVHPADREGTSDKGEYCAKYDKGVPTHCLNRDGNRTDNGSIAQYREAVGDIAPDHRAKGKTRCPPIGQRRR